MNHNPVITNWKQFKSDARRQWSKMEDDHFCAMEGNRAKLSREIQLTYHVAPDEADKQIARWEQECRKRNAA